MENELVKVVTDEAGSYLLIGQLIVRCWGCIEHVRAANEMAEGIRRELAERDEFMREQGRADWCGEESMYETMKRVEREG